MPPRHDVVASDNRNLHRRKYSGIMPPFGGATVRFVAAVLAVPRHICSRAAFDVQTADRLNLVSGGNGTEYAACPTIAKEIGVRQRRFA